MTPREKAIEALGDIIGRLEVWQRQHPQFGDAFMADVNEAKSELMRVQNRIEFRGV